MHAMRYQSGPMINEGTVEKGRMMIITIYNI